MYNLLYVPPQGSPNTPLVAEIVTEFCPIASPETIEILFEALQEPIV